MREIFTDAVTLNATLTIAPDSRPIGADRRRAIMPELYTVILFSGVSLLSAVIGMLVTRMLFGARVSGDTQGVVFADAPRRYEFREGYLLSQVDPNDAFLRPDVDRSWPMTRWRVRFARSMANCRPGSARWPVAARHSCCPPISGPICCRWPAVSKTAVSW
jgi:hypothetical protein